MIKFGYKLMSEEHGPAALVVVQIDRLEAINRRRGRAAGDAVLRAAARAVVEAAPRGALTGRIGGDRLAVLLTRTARDAAMPRAAAIGEAVRGCDVRGGNFAAIGFISTGPVAQFRPMMSTSNGSSAVSAAPISVPSSIVPVASRVT